MKSIWRFSFSNVTSVININTCLNPVHPQIMLATPLWYQDATHEQSPPVWLTQIVCVRWCEGVKWARISMCLSLFLQTGSLWQCTRVSSPGLRPGVCYSNRHGAGHRVPHLSSGDPLGSVLVDASPGTGGARRCRAHQGSLHRWVCVTVRV